MRAELKDQAKLVHQAKDPSCTNLKVIENSDECVGKEMSPEFKDQAKPVHQAKDPSGTNPKDEHEKSNDSDIIESDRKSDEEDNSKLPEQKHQDRSNMKSNGEQENNRDESDQKSQEVQQELNKNTEWLVYKSKDGSGSCSNADEKKSSHDENCQNPKDGHEEDSPDLPPTPWVEDRMKSRDEDEKISDDQIKQKEGKKNYSWSDYSHNELVRIGKRVAENKTGYEFGRQFDFCHHCLEEYWNCVLFFFEMPQRKTLREYKGINRNVNFGCFVSYLESVQNQRDDTTEELLFNIQF